MTRPRSLGTIAALLLAALSTVVWASEAPPMVNESARRIPIAESVDVVVIGGSTGAVSAAVAAAESGASVFLAAPRPYLGDDMTATLRLWLEEGEKPAAPLAKSLFDDPHARTDRPSPYRLAFTYSADRAAASKHLDTEPPKRLADLTWGDPIRDSVQYDDDVNLVVDLGGPKEIAGVHVWAYCSTAQGGYLVRDVTVFTSDDQKAWREAAAVDASATIQGGERVRDLAARFSAKARYLKLLVRKDPKAARILLGEIEVVRPEPAGAEAAPPLPPWPRPMHIKRTLDQALLDAGVKFLYSSYATDVLTDGQGKPCGVVIANRAGRQAVVAKVIVDATDRATVARLAGARFRPFPSGSQSFRRVVVGGRMRTGPEITARTIEPPYVGTVRAAQDSGLYPIIEYTLTLPIRGDDDASWARADQQARTLTYDPGQQFTSDDLFQIPPDAMFGRRTFEGEWQGVAQLPLEAFQPQGVERLLVLGGCADVPRTCAEKLARPLALIDLGASLGRAAAAEAARLPAPAEAGLRGSPVPSPAVKGNVHEFLSGVRPVEPSSAIPQDARPLPVLGRYDVVVIGGGTAGAPAGIGAARQGAKTLLVEYLQGLGGVGTTGAISKYYWGNRVGFAATVEEGLASWVIEQRMEWWRKNLLDAGAEIWFGAIGCGALVDGDRGNRVVGAVVVTPRGRGVVLADVVIDATGNADIAAAAGAPCVYTSAAEFAMQGTGLPPRNLGATYTNTDYTLTDETDLVDVWHLFVYAREKFEDAFDLGQLVDTRERRQIVGDYKLSILDQICERTFPDTIARGASDYDTHGYIIHPYLLLRHPLRRKITSDVPYRCLLPQGMEGLIVTGIGLSAHRDAQPIVRMQPDIQNQGYAAGAAAAMAAKEGRGVRAIDIRALQRHLVEIGNLPESVLSDVDSFPLPPERVAAAVDSIVDDYRSPAVIFAHRDAALPLLREAYRRGEGEKRMACAKVLAMLGDASGVETLIAEIEKSGQWDEPPAYNIGPDYPEVDRVGWGMSHLDNTLVALGRAGDPRAVPAVLEKLAMLRPETAFSHHRAVYLALEWLGDARAAEPLARLLQQPEMGGYAVTSIEDRARSAPTRSDATRELILARTLFRCGDWEGLAEKTLETYSHDLRGHFARHANAVLAAGKTYRPE